MASSSRTGNGAPVPPAMRTMGRKLQDARRDAGLTQQDAARNLEVTPQTLRNWEAGNHEPNDQFKQRLSEIYNVNVPDLVRPDDPEQALGLTPYSRVHADPKRLKLGRNRASLTQEETAERSGNQQVNAGAVRERSGYPQQSQPRNTRDPVRKTRKLVRA